VAVGFMPDDDDEPPPQAARAVSAISRTVNPANFAERINVIPFPASFEPQHTMIDLQKISRAGRPLTPGPFRAF